MPILPTGHDKTFRTTSQAGFTLVEVLVSLLILGLMTGLVILNLPKDNDTLHKRGQRIAAHFEMAAQASIFYHEPVGIRLTDSGYEAVRYLKNEWVPLRTFAFGTGIEPELELVQNGIKVDLKAAGKLGVPPIRFDATGLATPFHLKIAAGPDEIRIQGDVTGRIAFETEGL